MGGHFGECFNEDMVLRIALKSFVDAGSAPSGQHCTTLNQGLTRYDRDVTKSSLNTGWMGEWMERE